MADFLKSQILNSSVDILTETGRPIFLRIYHPLYGIKHSVYRLPYTGYVVVRYRSLVPTFSSVDLWSHIISGNVLGYFSLKKDTTIIQKIDDATVKN